jgi:hypothetical protein
MNNKEIIIQIAIPKKEFELLRIVSERWGVEQAGRTPEDMARILVLNSLNKITKAIKLL